MLCVAPRFFKIGYRHRFIDTRSREARNRYNRACIIYIYIYISLDSIFSKLNTFASIRRDYTYKNSKFARVCFHFLLLSSRNFHVPRNEHQNRRDNCLTLCTRGLFRSLLAQPTTPHDFTHKINLQNFYILILCTVLHIITREFCYSIGNLLKCKSLFYECLKERKYVEVYISWDIF